MNLALVLLGCAVSASAIANSDAASCANIKPDNPIYSEVPKGFALVPPCPHLGEIDQDYYFEGEATINGHIRYQDTYTFGPIAKFVVDEKSKALVPFGDRSLRISTWNINESLAIAVEAFHLPALKGKGRNCWVAPSSVRVKAIWVAGGGNDASGTYLTKFTVLSVGKFVACKAETD